MRKNSGAFSETRNYSRDFWEKRLLQLQTPGSLDCRSIFSRENVSMQGMWWYLKKNVRAVYFFFTTSKSLEFLRPVRKTEERFKSQQKSQTSEFYTFVRTQKIGTNAIKLQKYFRIWSSTLLRFWKRPPIFSFAADALVITKKWYTVIIYLFIHFKMI